MSMAKKTQNLRGLLIKEILKRPDFLLTTLVGILTLSLAYYWLLLQVSDLKTTFGNISPQPIYLGFITILVPATLLLFGANLGLAILLFRAGGGLKWQGGSLLGSLVGGFGAACPVCGAFLLSLIGVTVGLTALPFAGLEIWTASSAIMGFTFWKSLSQLDQKTCDPTVEGASCWRLPMVSKTQLIVLAFLSIGLAATLASVAFEKEGIRIFARRIDASMNANQTGDGEAANALFAEYEKKVTPEEGVTLPILWGDWLPKLVRAGIIDSVKLEESFARNGGLTDEQRKLLSAGSEEFIKIDKDNNWFLVTVFWPLGLANKIEINRNSPIAGKDLFNFASTGGWTLGRAENGGSYFNKYELVKLTTEQEKLVKELAENFYRPCCNNSTFYQDCNHGSALLGLLELGASQGLTREQLAEAALVANSYWFPQQYIATAVYLEKVKGVSWSYADPEYVLGGDFSTISGFQKAHQELASNGLVPQQKGGSKCGV